MTTQTDFERLQATGKNAYASIVELVSALDADTDNEEALERIQEDALSVRIRYGWHAPGTSKLDTDCEYELLLATGGPAVRIIGDLDEHNEPCSARLEVQDWFLPWTVYAEASQDVLLSYARCFYYGE